MIHYHGLPITPGGDRVAYRVLRGRHAFASFFYPRQTELAASICQSFSLDNGAYSAWKAGKPMTDADRAAYYEWAALWLRHPACDWAVIPDVIGGTEEENDALVRQWPLGFSGVPVWHLNESTERLVRLAEDWPRIALGSAAEFDVKRPGKCIDRLREALAPISDDGVPLVKLHGLRMLNPAITSVVPLASADSTNVARNCGLDNNWRGTYAPTNEETRALVIAERIEAVETPGRMDMGRVASLFDDGPLWEETA